MPAPDALIRAYLATRYDVRLVGGRRVSLRIGDAVPSILRDGGTGFRCAAIITACNPRSERLDAGANRLRLRRLREDLERLDARCLAAVGHDRSQGWRETSLCVMGPAIATLDELARRHAQNAIVVLAREVRLRIERTDWRALAGDDPRIDFA